MSSITVESLGIEAGDLIEAVGQDGEAHRGKALLYNGRMYIGRNGCSIEKYVADDYTVKVVERAPRPIDKLTVARIVNELRKRHHLSAAEIIEEEFGEIDAF